jgi:transcriptional regulator NrdR family protein
MTNFVTKKDGEKVAFDPEKITHSIMLACQDAELDEAMQADITKQTSSVVMMNLENKEEVSTTEIKNMILSELDATHPNVSDAWKKYDEGKSE